MTTNKYLHGVEFEEVAGNSAITTGSTSIIGIVGDLVTDPATAELPPLNTPFLVKSKQDMVGWVSGTLFDYCNEIFKQTSPTIVAIRVAGEETNVEANVYAEGEAEDDTGEDTDEGTDDDTDPSNVVADACAGDDIAKTGIFALENAASIVKVKPKLLVIPYYDQLSKGGIAITNMLLVAERLRAIAIVSGPNTTDDEAITFAESQDNSRMYIADPYYLSTDSVGTEKLFCPTAMVAAMFAKTDEDYGFWCSPSNKTVVGINSLNRPISFQLSNPDTTANYLNEAGVSTLIYSESSKSFKLWGNRSSATNVNEVFISVRRTMDTIEDSIEVAMEEELDKPITGETANQIQNKVQTYLNTLISQGALLGGTCWVDQAENPVEQLKNGNLVISFDCEPPAPMERLTFKVYRNDGYYNEVFN
ncbi:Putative prophage major tail sheath protein [Candidatus Hepatincola sp. Av]